MTYLTAPSILGERHLSLCTEIVQFFLTATVARKDPLCPLRVFCITLDNTKILFDLGSGRVSVIQNLEVVHYLGVANVLIIYKNKLVHCMLSVIRRLSPIGSVRS